MEPEPTQLTDAELVARLLDLATALYAKGRFNDSETVGMAAARILDIPRLAATLLHPSAKMPADVNPFRAVVDEIAYRNSGAANA